MVQNRNLKVTSPIDHLDKRHSANLEQSAEDGTLLIAGRWSVGIGPAIVVIENDSEIEAHVFIEADPFAAKGLM